MSMIFGNHNQWLNAINAALTRDRLLTDKIKFRPLALKKQLVLNKRGGTPRGHCQP